MQQSRLNNQADSGSPADLRDDKKSFVPIGDGHLVYRANPMPPSTRLVAIRRSFAMVQVRIEIEYNVDLQTTDLIPGAFQGKVTLNTAHGHRHQFFDFVGTGDIEKAKEIALGWVTENMLEHTNPSCRPMRYLKVAEQ
jgi:hypothetical protein